MLAAIFYQRCELSKLQQCFFYAELVRQAMPDAAALGDSNQ